MDAVSVTIDVHNGPIASPTEKRLSQGDSPFVVSGMTTIVEGGLSPLSPGPIAPPRGALSAAGGAMGAGGAKPRSTSVENPVSVEGSISLERRGLSESGSKALERARASSVRRSRGGDYMSPPLVVEPPAAPPAPPAAETTPGALPPLMTTATPFVSHAVSSKPLASPSLTTESPAVASITSASTTASPAVNEGAIRAAGVERQRSRDSTAAEANIISSLEGVSPTTCNLRV